MYPQERKLQFKENHYLNMSPGHFVVQSENKDEKSVNVEAKSYLLTRRNAKEVNNMSILV